MPLSLLLVVLVVLVMTVLPSVLKGISIIVFVPTTLATAIAVRR
jgi:hypothetical protein